MVATFPSQSTAPSGRPLSEGEKTATLIRGFATQSASRSPETPFDLIQYSGEVTGEPRTFRTALLRSGVRVVSVEPRSGIVTEAAMAQSTGNPILDNSAVSTFRTWRFKPWESFDRQHFYWITVPGASH
jgi:TonB family protein